MLEKILDKYNIVLASKSPRRKELLRKIIPDFSIDVRPINETFSSDLQKEKIPQIISKLKSDKFKPLNDPTKLIITADTIVCLKDLILGKPKNKDEAVSMLKMLSGETHKVYTGVTILDYQKSDTFYDVTEVTFYDLSDKEIIDYIDICQPYDKAGSYGIQEWMGHVGIRKMNGDYFNVMGLPLHKLYRRLQLFD